MTESTSKSTTSDNTGSKGTGSSRAVAARRRTIRFSAILCVLCAAAFGLPAVAADPVVEGLQTCDFGKRSEAAPEELEQFAFLVGNWDIENRSLQRDGSWSEQTTPSYWEGRWILGGHAIADYWYNTPPATAPGEDLPGRGVNVRMYREDSGQWTNMWQHSVLAEVRTLVSEVRDDGYMHMWATHPDTSDQRRMHFVVESENRWVRIEERPLGPNGAWIKVHRIEATRAPCPWRPKGMRD